MGSLAVATLVGHLTRDAELKYTNSGQPICSFSVATNTRAKKGDQWVDEPNYWDIELWGKRAETINQYLTKGKAVAVSGDMRQDKWEKDGQQRMKIKVNASSVEFVGGGGEARSPNGSGYAEGRSSTASADSGRQDYRGEGNVARQAPQGRPTSQPSSSRSAEQGPGGDDFTDDIPF